MTHEQQFSRKEAARRYVWDTMQQRKVARFPFPPHNRIPNFAGAREAADRLFRQPLLHNVKRMKVNPDAPQRYVRIRALEAGILVFMPTPRLRGGFWKLDPATIPEADLSHAASLSKGKQFAETVGLADLPQMDLIVAGSVAVTRNGKRCGKGHGYSDLEYAILRELGHKPVPVVTTVHPVQLVADFPGDAHDLPLSLIVTPDEVLEVASPPPAPSGIEWDLISREDREAMPVLEELWQSTR